MTIENSDRPRKTSIYDYLDFERTTTFSRKRLESEKALTLSDFNLNSCSGFKFENNKIDNLQSEIVDTDYIIMTPLVDRDNIDTSVFEFIYKGRKFCPIISFEIDHLHLGYINNLMSKYNKLYVTFKGKHVIIYYDISSLITKTPNSIKNILKYSNLSSNPVIDHYFATKDRKSIKLKLSTGYISYPYPLNDLDLERFAGARFSLDKNSDNIEILPLYKGTNDDNVEDFLKNNNSFKLVGRYKYTGFSLDKILNELKNIDYIYVVTEGTNVCVYTKSIYCTFGKNITIDDILEQDHIGTEGC